MAELLFRSAYPITLRNVSIPNVPIYGDIKATVTFDVLTMVNGTASGRGSITTVYGTSTFSRMIMTKDNLSITFDNPLELMFTKFNIRVTIGSADVPLSLIVPHAGTAGRGPTSSYRQAQMLFKSSGGTRMVGTAQRQGGCPCSGRR